MLKHPKQINTQIINTNSKFKMIELKWYNRQNNNNKKPLLLRSSLNFKNGSQILYMGFQIMISWLKIMEKSLRKNKK